MSTKVLFSGKLPTYAPGAPNRSSRGNRVVNYKRMDFNIFSGTYRIDGTTAVAGAPDVPVSREVNIFFKKSGRLARKGWSDAAGNYQFLMVGEGPWFVTTHDHTGEYNAVIADNIYGTPI